MVWGRKKWKSKRIRGSSVTNTYSKLEYIWKVSVPSPSHKYEIVLMWLVRCDISLTRTLSWTVTESNMEILILVPSAEVCTYQGCQEVMLLKDECMVEEQNSRRTSESWEWELSQKLSCVDNKENAAQVVEHDSIGDQLVGSCLGLGLCLDGSYLSRYPWNTFFPLRS